MAETPNWERLDTDTDKSYEAFCIYRDMGSNRSIRKVAQELSKSDALIFRWSTENNWVNRISEYDDHLKDEHRKRIESARLEVADNVLSDYKRFRKAIDKRLKIMEDADFKSSPSELHDVLGLMHRLDDYARRAVGLPSEIRESKNTNSTNVNGTLNVNNRQLPPLPDDLLDEILKTDESEE